MFEEFDDEVDDILVKKDIVIHVQPHMVVGTIGLLRSFLPDIVEHMNGVIEEAGLDLNDNLHSNMQEVLDEIYEKCIVETDYGEMATKWTEVFELTGGIWPNGKES